MLKIEGRNKNTEPHFLNPKYKTSRALWTWSFKIKQSDTCLGQTLALSSSVISVTTLPKFDKLLDHFDDQVDGFILRINLIL